MLYMVIEKYKDKEAVYKRFHENGRMMPDGVSYVSSWVTADGNTCYQINEAENEELLHEWASNWNDVTDFEFIPVIFKSRFLYRRGYHISAVAVHYGTLAGEHDRPSPQ